MVIMSNNKLKILIDNFKVFGSLNIDFNENSQNLFITNSSANSNLASIGFNSNLYF